LLLLPFLQLRLLLVNFATDAAVVFQCSDGCVIADVAAAIVAATRVAVGHTGFTIAAV